MKIEHEYCDVCRKQMTMEDSDFDIESYGVF